MSVAIHAIRGQTCIEKPQWHTPRSFKQDTTQTHEPRSLAGSVWKPCSTGDNTPLFNVVSCHSTRSLNQKDLFFILASPALVSPNRRHRRLVVAKCCPVESVGPWRGQRRPKTNPGINLYRNNGWRHSTWPLPYFHRTWERWRDID